MRLPRWLRRRQLAARGRTEDDRWVPSIQVIVDGRVLMLGPYDSVTIRHSHRQGEGTYRVTFEPMGDGAAPPAATHEVPTYDEWRGRRPR